MAVAVVVVWLTLARRIGRAGPQQAFDVLVLGLIKCGPHAWGGERGAESQKKSAVMAAFGAASVTMADLTRLGGLGPLVEQHNVMMADLARLGGLDPPLVQQASRWRT